jgi:hypothetical protein
MDLRVLKHHAVGLRTRGLIEGAGRVPSRRKLAVVLGNCQADALSRILRNSPAFAAEYQLARIPGVHLARPAEVQPLHRLVGRADLVLTQQVRDGYRDLALGTDELLANARPGTRILRYPSMFYKGLHPYSVYVHATGQLGTMIAMTGGYHDLRHLYAASRGWDDAKAAAWLSEFESDPGQIRRLAEASLEELRRREPELDAGISHVVDGLGVGAFYTLNHPSNAVLATAADGLLAHLDMPAVPRVPGREHLGLFRAPVEPSVLRAQGKPVPAEEATWFILGKHYRQPVVLAAHLAYYRSRPEVLSAGLEEHAALMADLGLS